VRLDHTCIAALGGIATLLAACAGTPPERFYTLSATVEPGDPVSPHSKLMRSVVVQSVALPELVDRPQFVVRAAENRVIVSEQNRWAEPLKREIPRVIAEDLTRLLDGAQVWAYPSNTSDEGDYRVFLNFQRFESTLGKGVTIDVLWNIRTASAERSQSGRSVVQEPARGDGYDAVVAAHGRALDAVSRDIAQAVRALDSKSH
jgi:uncharacterized protein